MKRILLFIIGILCSLQLFGQVIFDDLLSSLGDCYETSTIMYSWSLGECMIETFVDSNMLNQGGNNNLMFENLQVSVHPNPAINHVELKISKELDPLDGCFIEIYDLGSNCLMKEALLSHNQNINISNFNKKTLVIRITMNQFILKSLIIQKIH